jgi:hypothetical protein
MLSQSWKPHTIQNSITSQTTMTTTVSSSNFYIILNQIAALDPTKFQDFLDSITLTPDQTDRLRQIANRFAVVYSSPESTPSVSATSVSNSPWKALYRCNNLVLAEVYLSILSSSPEHFVNSYNTATIHDGCISATKASQQQSIQRLRELFIALALYDFIRSRFPRFSGNRLSDRMKDEMISLLPGVDVVEQYRMGKNLDHLCKCFGVGCGFYLAEYLSKDL